MTHLDVIGRVENLVDQFGIIPTAAQGYRLIEHQGKAHDQAVVDYVGRGVLRRAKGHRLAPGLDFGEQIVVAEIAEIFSHQIIDAILKIRRIIVEIIEGKGGIERIKQPFLAQADNRTLGIEHHPGLHIDKGMGMRLCRAGCEHQQKPGQGSAEILPAGCWHDAGVIAPGVGLAKLYGHDPAYNNRHHVTAFTRTTLPG